MKYCVGLTGSIASGKSTVAQMFLQLGADLVCSDTIARQLTEKGMPALQKIVEHFGENILKNDGSLNRSQLRDIIFHYPEQRIWLEDLLHPLIREKLWQDAQIGTGPYCIVDIPLLYSKTPYPWLHRILVVTSSEKAALSRIMKRDECSEETARIILSHQRSQVEYEKLADDLIVNDGSLEDLESKVKALHAVYMEASIED